MFIAPFLRLFEGTSAQIPMRAVRNPVGAAVTESLRGGNEPRTPKRRDQRTKAERNASRTARRSSRADAGAAPGEHPGLLGEAERERGVECARGQILGRGGPAGAAAAAA